MTDNTISFRADMIDLIMSGRKTVTIRPMKPQPEQIHVLSENGLFDRMYMQWQGRDLSEKGSGWLYDRYPHGRVGEVITVRERNDLQLRIIGIRVSRLPDIDRNWWLMDGLTFDIKVIGGEDKSIHHWNSFYGDTEYRWDKNMWVWVIEFKLVRGCSK